MDPDHVKAVVILQAILDPDSEIAGDARHKADKGRRKGANEPR